MISCSVRSPWALDSKLRKYRSPTFTRAGQLYSSSGSSPCEKATGSEIALKVEAGGYTDEMSLFVSGTPSSSSTKVSSCSEFTPPDQISGL